MKVAIFLIFLTVILIMVYNSKNQTQTIDFPADAFLVDVRLSIEYAADSVPNSINIPLDQIEKSLQKFEGKKNIVVFCRSGNRSGKAKTILNAKGVNNVINGGSWKNVKFNLQSKN